jgi:two-component sensor histidine kinase
MNSVKYAFPDGREGKVMIGVPERDGTITLTCSDNSVGAGGYNACAARPSASG